jgi:predicted PurR-regulated permease PerM
MPSEAPPPPSIPPASLSDEELPRLTMSVAAPELVRGRRVALGILLLLSSLAVARIAAPLWVGIAFGTMVAFVAQPGYRRLAYRLGNRRSLAAAMMTTLAGVITLLSGAAATYVLTRELFVLIARLQGRARAGSLEWILGETGMGLLAKLGIDRVQAGAWFSRQLEQLAGYAAQAAGVLLQTTTSALLGLVIGLMTMYYVLLEWRRIPVHLERVLPLDPRHTRALVLEFRDVGRAAMVGTIATALLQGILGWIGYGLVQLPQAFIWGLITGIASFLPVAGTMLVWTPIGIWLIAEGRLLAGVFVLLWGFFMVVGMVDYVVRPRMVRGHGSTNPLLMLIALLGGLDVFGLAGLLVGPILMSLFLAIMRIYEREVSSIV